MEDGRKVVLEETTEGTIRGCHPSPWAPCKKPNQKIAPSGTRGDLKGEGSEEIEHNYIHTYTTTKRWFLTHGCQEG